MQYASVSQIMTDYMEMEPALREELHMMRMLMETSPNSVYFKDRDSRYIKINGVLAAKLGLRSAQEARGQSDADFFPLEYAQESIADEQEIMRSGVPIMAREQRESLPNREERWVSITKMPFYDLEGEVAGTFGITRDITEHKRAAEAAAFESYLLRALMDNLPDSIYFKDSASKFTRVNRHLAEFVGLTDPGEAVGKSDCDFFSEELARLSFNDEQEIIRTGVPILGQEEREVWPDGHETWVLTTKMPLRDAEGHVVGTFGMSRDISESKKVERMKSEFVSTVSHELRTPLTSIRGSLGLIAGGVAGEISPQVKAMVDIAYNNSERLVRLINDILDMEKIESGKMVFDMTPAALMPLVEQAIEANQSYAEQQGVKFTLKQSLPDGIANVDSDRTIQVLTNLLSNAAKFSPQGGTVDVSVVRRGGRIRVSVEDHGPGISEEFSRRIFQKFAQADSSDTRQKGGTGLGLSISKAIVEHFGGELAFETEVGKGTTFYFDLPEWQSYSANLPDLEASHGGRQLHILICEDDPDVAKLLSIMLSQGGFTSDIAHSVAEAKERLGQNSYDAMTLDLMLPDEDGLTLIRELRDQTATHDLPIVVVSAKAQLGKSELNGNAVAVIDWIDKPIDKDQLLMSVRRATQHQAGSQKTTHGPRILHVEDDPDIVQVVTLMLSGFAEVSSASTLTDAHRMLSEEQFDLVILDLVLPDGTGLDLLPHVNQTGPLTSVVLFSAQEVDLASVKAAGNVDAALVKTRTSSKKLLSTITELINKNREFRN